MLTFVENGLAGCRLAVQRQAVAVVVDALRASANVASMFHYGTEEMLVVREVEEAFSEKTRWADAILVGERGGPMVPGFDLGNSPLREAPAISVRHVVFSSSNCSRCCVGAAGAPAAFLGTTVNARATARALIQACRRLGRDEVVLITAGSVLDEVRLTVEDHVAASALMQTCEDEGVAVQPGNDRAAACRALCPGRDQGALTAWFRNSENGRSLAKLGLGVDVEFASRLDVFGVAPRVCGLVDLSAGGCGALLRRA